MNIRRALPEDADAVADMVRAIALDIGSSIIPKVTGDQVRTLMSEPNPLLRVWVAEAENQLIGTILLEPFFSTWRGKMGFYIVDLYVDATWRGEHIGKKLIAAAAKEAKTLGYEFLKLDVERGNDGAKKFYARLGFSTSTEAIMFLEKSGLDALLSDLPTR